MYHKDDDYGLFYFRKKKIDFTRKKQFQSEFGKSRKSKILLKKKKNIRESKK